MIVAKTFNTSTEITGLFPGRDHVVHCSADVSIAFWDPQAGDFDSATVDVTAPGDVVMVPNQKAQITSAGDCNIRILLAE